MKSTNEINAYLKRLKNGEECLEEFFNAVSGHVKFIAYINLVDKSFVDDVVNDTFDKVFKNIGDFDENLSGKAWINKIARNEAYTINNRERKHYHASLDEASEEIACTTDFSQGLEFDADLQTALDKLEEQDRKMVMLRIFEDMTYEEIANRQNMYVGTVYKQIKSSLKKIRKDIRKGWKNYRAESDIDK